MDSKLGRAFLFAKGSLFSLGLKMGKTSADSVVGFCNAVGNAAPHIDHALRCMGLSSLEDDQGPNPDDNDLAIG